MAVCQFFLRGQCRFGDQCRNEHPAADARQPGFGTNAWNRNATPASAKQDLPYSAATITNDLNSNTDKPLWPLSSYAPFKHEALLIEGLDESPEELRFKAVTAMKTGNMNEYIQYEANQIAAAEERFNNVRNNVSQAHEQAAKQSKLVPHPSGTTSAFSSTFPSSSSAFNTTSTTPSAFGNTTAPSAFGSTAPTSTFGNTATPSAFAPTSTPLVFGSPATNSAFGKPSFGQPAFGQPAFGQTSAPAPSAFGQPANTTAPVSAFSQPAQGQSTSAFGQPTTTTSTFGQSSFGQPAQAGGSSVIKPATGAFSAFAGNGASAFGSGATPSNTTGGTSGGGAFSAFAGQQPTAFGAIATPTNNSGSVFGQPAFGQPAPAAQPTAQPGQSTSSVFGQPSAFGQQQQQPSVFGAFNTSGTSSVFGQGSFGTPAQPPTQPASTFGSAFGNPGTNNAQQPVSAFAPASQSQSTLSAPAAAPSISMASSTSPMSVFGAPSPISSGRPLFGAPPASVAAAAKPSSAIKQTTIDFTSLIARTAYKPGATPYDSQLPQNYGSLLPSRVSDAFKGEKFNWGWKGENAVPEWVPPVDVR